MKVQISESKLNAIIKESIIEILKEDIEEGLGQQLKAGWNGLRQGVQGQQLLDRGTDGFKQNFDRDDEAAIADPFASRPENTASMQARQAYEMYKKYKTESDKYLALYNKLTNQYNLNKDGVGQRSSKETVVKGAGITPFRKPTRPGVPNARGYNTVDKFQA